MLLAKIVILILSYLVGSIPFGFIIGKLKGHDIREEGSHNIGATNVGRILGAKYAVITYCLDMFKGFVFVFLFQFGLLPSELCVINPLLYGLLANIGHCFSIFLKFKGGKSVACGSGAIAGYNPILLPIMLLIFFIIKKMSKLVSLSSLLCTLLIFIGCLAYALISNQFKYLEIKNTPLIYAMNYWFCLIQFLLVCLIYIKHTQNIKRIIHKEEKPIHY